MKNSPFVHFNILFLAAFALLINAHAAQVEVIGFGLIQNKNIAIARQAAIDDAKRLAVEQLLGSFIQSRTVTKNFMLASEKVYATTQGRIDNFDIIEESKVDETTYQVKIRAFINANAAAQDALQIINQNQWAKKPRVRIVNNTQQDALSINEVVAHLSELLSKDGFVVLAEDSPLGSSFELEISGKIKTTQSSYQGIDIQTSRLSVSGKLINSTTHDQVTSFSFAEKKAGDDGKAVNKMSKKLAKRISQKIKINTHFAWLTKHERPVLIALNNVSEIQAALIESDLQQAVAGLSGITTESKNNKNYVLAAAYLGWPEQLYDQLNQLSQRSDIRFNVVSFEQSQLTLSVK